MICARLRAGVREELAPRRHPREEVAHRDACAHGAGLRLPPHDARPRPARRHADRLAARAGDDLDIAGCRDRRQRLAAEAERARRGQGRRARRSSRSRGVRRRARLRPARMPRPSSVTRMRPSPPSSISTVIRVAPASMALSSSSRTTETGRSMTSPAAIRAPPRAGGRGSARARASLSLGDASLRRASGRCGAAPAARTASGSPRSASCRRHRAAATALFDAATAAPKNAAGVGVRRLVAGGADRAAAGFEFRQGGARRG